MKFNKYLKPETHGKNYEKRICIATVDTPGGPLVCNRPVGILWQADGKSIVKWKELNADNVGKAVKHKWQKCRVHPLFFGVLRLLLNCCFFS